MSGVEGVGDLGTDGSGPGNGKLRNVLAQVIEGVPVEELHGQVGQVVAVGGVHTAVDHGGDARVGEALHDAHFTAEAFDRRGLGVDGGTGASTQEKFDGHEWGGSVIGDRGSFRGRVSSAVDSPMFPTDGADDTKALRHDLSIHRSTLTPRRSHVCSEYMLFAPVEPDSNTQKSTENQLRTLHACLQSKHTSASKCWQLPRGGSKLAERERATEQQPGAGIAHSLLHEGTPCPGKEVTWETNLTPHATHLLPKYPVDVDLSLTFSVSGSFPSPRTTRTPKAASTSTRRTETPGRHHRNRDLTLLASWTNRRHPHMDTGNTENFHVGIAFIAHLLCKEPWTNPLPNRRNHSPTTHQPPRPPHPGTTLSGPHSGRARADNSEQPDHHG